MNTLTTTYLAQWLKERLRRHGWGMDQLRTFQLEQLNRTLKYVFANSPFYHHWLKDGPVAALTDLAQTEMLPFTTADDLRRHHLDMLCIPHGQVARVVTLQTPGTPSTPKRIYFSEDDLALTIDFFHHGMAGLVRPGQRVLILLPGSSPDSVGDLLKRGLDRMAAKGVIHWPVLNLDAILDQIRDLRIDCLVGPPAPIFALCRRDAHCRHPHNLLKRVLLSTDYIPRAVVAEIKRVWGCPVFEHYGMTEMGYGGGLDCDAHRGYHLRELDLLVEIVDPRSGRCLPPGVSGEVVFTTLSRRAMPLIRYRTGDLACWLEQPCPCGSNLPLLGKVQGRLGDETVLSMPILDELLLVIPGLYAFQARVQNQGLERSLELILCCEPDRADGLKQAVRNALKPLLEIRFEKQFRRIEIHTHSPESLSWDASGMVKRAVAGR